MGPKFRKTFSIAVFVLLSIISFSYLIFILNKQSAVVYASSPLVFEPILSAEVQKRSQILPVRLRIPSINVDAAVENVGLTPAGAMEVPSNILDVGWYTLGSLPGATGSAVISGHFDGSTGESGVFNNLDKLKPGDKIYVVNDQGATIVFVVRESRTYNPGYADDVFFPNDNGTHLNLITCDGVWDGAKKSYSKRLVVFSDIL